MTYTEFGTLMETKGVDGMLRLWNRTRLMFGNYTRLEYGDYGWAALKSDGETHLSNLEYQEYLTPGQELDEILNSGHRVPRGSEFETLYGRTPLLEWRNKHKDLLDKVKE